TGAADALATSPVNGHGYGNPGAGNSGSAGTTIGLDHIAVQHNRVFAQCFGIHNGTQAASNQPRNLLGATRDFTTHRFACTALSGGSRQHGVFGGHPATVFALEPARYS